MADVSLVGDCKERVAYDLMRLISAADGEGVTQDRAYWLTLYQQCLRVTSGYDPKPNSGPVIG